MPQQNLHFRREGDLFADCSSGLFPAASCWGEGAARAGGVEGGPLLQIAAIFLLLPWGDRFEPCLPLSNGLPESSSLPAVATNSIDPRWLNTRRSTKLACFAWGTHLSCLVAGSGTPGVGVEHLVQLNPLTHPRLVQLNPRALGVEHLVH